MITSIFILLCVFITDALSFALNSAEVQIPRYRDIFRQTPASFLRIKKNSVEKSITQLRDAIISPFDAKNDSSDTKPTDSMVRSIRFDIACFPAFFLNVKALIDI